MLCNLNISFISGSHKIKNVEIVSICLAQYTIHFEKEWIYLYEIILSSFSVHWLPINPLRKEDRRKMTKKPTYEELEQKIRELEKVEFERKIAVDLMRKNEERYRLFVQHFRGIAYQGDMNFIPIFFHGAVEEITGYTDRELIDGKPRWDQVIHPEDLPALFTEDEERLHSLPAYSYEREYRIVRKDGAVRWVYEIIQNICDDSGKPAKLQGAIYDITERKQIEEELKRSEERYQLISELTSDYSYAYRVQPDGELILEWVTDALPRLAGFTREEIRSRGGWESLIFPEDMPIPLGQLKSLFSNQSKAVEYRITDKAGNIRWMRDIAKPIWDEKENRLKQIYGAVQEFTEQKEAEEALRSSHERFLTVMDSLDATIYVADMETYEILFMNKHMVASFGRDLTGEICWDVFRNEAGPCSHCTNDRLIDAKGEPTDVCVWQGKNPITGKWYINYDRAIKWDDDRLVHLQIASDITHLKALEKERMQYEENLQKAQKLEAIGTLAGGIAHDFNNILSAIIGYTELSLNDVEKESTLYQNLQEVFRAGGRAKDLVKQILTFSRQNEQELKPVQIKLISKEAIKFLRASLPTTIEIHQEIESDSLVMADPTQIHQILMNLCTNAGHAMREKGGVLEVKLKNVKFGEDLAAEHPELKPGPYLELAISDTGHGISAHILDRIFDPFFTTKEKSEGTGMGLSVVHGIVGSHGGKVIVSSEPGKGSTFKIYLPTVERDEAPQPIAEEPIATGTERILFVDDEPSLVKIGKQMLESLGYKVTGRTSSIEALELFKAKAHSFDLVITDMTMPNMTGDELARELIRINPEISVILCTGYSTRINQQKAAAMGIRALVSKPVLRRDIAETIRDVLAEK
ncbi:MAG: PAS domain-containing protein [Desulfobacterales bacterium]